MLQQCLELHQNSRSTDAAQFQMSDWNTVSRAVCARYGSADYTGPKCRTKYDELKKTWKLWQGHLSRVSGWGRNNNDLPSNTEEVEDHTT